MNKMIGPGATLVCVQAMKCDCGSCGVTQGSMYLCEEIAPDFGHAFMCAQRGCIGVVIAVEEKHHAICATAFAPLDDGDDSLVRDEIRESYDDFLKRDAPAREPERLRGPEIDHIWFDERPA